MGFRKFRNIIKTVAPVGKALTAGTPAGAVFGAVEHFTKDTRPKESKTDPPTSLAEIERVAIIAPIIRETLKRALGTTAIALMDAFAGAWEYAAEHEEGRMTPREQTLKLLEEYEGRRGCPYQCPAGHWTIGVGHNLEASPIPGWSKDMPTDFVLDAAGVDRLLEADVEKFAAEVDRLGLPSGLKDEAREILLRMCFQIGTAGVRKFRKMLLALGRHDYAEAAKEMLDSRWARSDSPRRAREEAARMEALA